MARAIGNRKPGVRDRDPVASLNSNHNFKSNNHDRLGIMLFSYSNDYKFVGLSLVRMNADRSWQFVDGNHQDQLFRNYKRAFATPYNVAFSADKTWAVLTTSAVSVAEGNLNDHRYGMQFFKWNAALKRYDHLDSVAGGLSINYPGDISGDGQFAAGRSASTPYLEFWQRTNDTWAKLPAITASVEPTSIGCNKIFNDNFNIAYWGNNSNNTAGAFVGYQFDGTKFSQVTLSGVGLNGYQQVEFNDQGYFACGDVSFDLGLFKTTDGTNFTDLTSNISGMPAFAHYNLKWDPTGTYLFANVNNASYAFSMYKRSGDNLTLLSNAFDVMPPAADVTLRDGVTWSPDGKFLFIAGATGTASLDGCQMYERIGDQFYRVDLITENISNAASPAVNVYGDKSWLHPLAALRVYKLHWL